MASRPEQGESPPHFREGDLESLPTALVLGLAPSGMLRCIGNGCEPFLGCSAEAGMGRPISDWIDGEKVTIPRLLENDGRNLLRLRRDGMATMEVLATATLLHMEQADPVLLLVLHDAAEVLSERSRLETSEARLRAVLGGMLDGVVTIDDHGMIHDASDSVLRVFGYTPQELIGNNISMLMPEPHHSQHDDYLARYRETGRTWILDTTREFEVVGNGGRRLHVELSVSRVELPGHKSPLFVGSFRDITSRKRAEQALLASEQRFRAIFDQEFQLVLLLRDDGAILEVNRTLLQTTGHRRDELVGQGFVEAPFWDTPEEHRRPLELALAQALQGQVARLTVHLSSSEGVRRRLDLSIKSFEGQGVDSERAGESLGLLLAEARDMTELEAARRREYEVQQALAALGERAAVLAHEMKTPVTAVHMALRAVARELGQNEREVLDDLVQRMRKLEDLLQGTLDFSRPIAVKPRRIPPDRLVQSTVAMVGEWTAAHQVAIELQLPEELPALVVDPERCALALSNLLRNACEAGQAGTRIRVTATRGEAGRLILWVDDDGPGIPLEDRERLFQPFVTDRLDGNGIGLPLARRIAEAHGGHLTCHASPLGGARFQLILPCEPQGRGQ